MKRAAPPVQPDEPLLDVRDLHVSYTALSRENSAAIAGVSFAFVPGETLGVLGESGSGKSALALALLRVLPVNGRIEKGAIHFQGQDLLLAKPGELEKIRGERIALIFQEPSLALHPAIRIEEQIGEVRSRRIKDWIATHCGKGDRQSDRANLAWGDDVATLGRTRGGTSGREGA